MTAFIDPICGFGLHAFDSKSPSSLISVIFSYAISICSFLSIPLTTLVGTLSVGGFHVVDYQRMNRSQIIPWWSSSNADSITSEAEPYLRGIVFFDFSGVDIRDPGELNRALGCRNTSSSFLLYISNL